MEKKQLPSKNTYHLEEIMPNVPIELSLNDTPIQQMSTTTILRRRRKSSLVKRNNAQPLEDLIQQLRNELQKIGLLVTELQSRIELTEQINQLIVGELKSLLSENESESHTTVVEVNQKSEKCDRSSHKQEITIPELSTTLSSESSITTNADDTNDSFNRICSALQNLIIDAQVALQKPKSSSSSNQLLGIPQTTTRPRAQSWSSNIGSWIMNHYNPSPEACDCKSCWLCKDSNNNSLSSSSTTTTTRINPRSSRANSISSIRHSSFSLTHQQRESDRRQIHLAGIKKQYSEKLERRFDYRKSCDDLDMELQKLVTTAISTGIEHGLIHSPIYRQYQFHDDESMERDDFSFIDDNRQDKLNRYNYFRNHDDEEMSDESYDEIGKHKELENTILNDNSNNEKESSKWRHRILDCLQKLYVNYNNRDDCNEGKDNNGDDDKSNWYGSSRNSSSSNYRDNSNEGSSNPFTSYFTNIGQNSFNFDVNLINSTKNNYNNKSTDNYFNEINNSSHSTSTTNNYYNYNTNEERVVNNREEKSSRSNSRKSIYKQSLPSRCMNCLAMIGLMISMSQTIISKPATRSSSLAFMNVVARNITRSGMKGRRGEIKVIKYFIVLFVGWVAGRIGKRNKKSFNENNQITEITEVPPQKHEKQI